MMAIFDDEDRTTVRSLGFTMAGFAALTVLLIIGAVIVST